MSWPGLTPWQPITVKDGELRILIRDGKQILQERWIRREYRPIGQQEIMPAIDVWKDVPVVFED